MPDKLKLYRFYSKILLVFSLLMIGIIISSLMFYSYKKNLKNAEAYRLEKLSGIARTLALNIDGDVHEKLVCAFPERDAIKTNKENHTYQKFHQLLKRTQEVNQLETSIYTLFRSSTCSGGSEENAFLFGVSSTNPFFRHKYEIFPEELNQKFETGGEIGKYTSDSGNWLSAFYPIKNRSGETVAVVHVDEQFDTFISAARAKLINDSFYALIFLGILALIFLYVYQRILKSMSNINVTLEEAVSRRTMELHESNSKLKKLNGKLGAIVESRTKELQVSNEKLKSFARVASHDLRSPLRSISGFAQLFKRRYKNLVDDEGNEYLEFITSNTQKMSDLITDILSTSLVANENSAEFKVVDLNVAINDVQANLKELISSKHAQILYEDLPSIEGYTSEFVQLFQNLISNSIKYSRPEVAPQIYIESQTCADFFIVKIKDNGKGISEEALKNIFKEFDRGDATDNEGYGIGLATCLRIINEYHGTMQVDSTLGEGTTFEIILKNRKTANESYNEAVDASMGTLQN